MSRIPLSQFAEQNGQTRAAVLLGMSQGALNKALRVGRDVHVIQHADGTYSAEELRPFPVQSAKRTAA
ncbi:Cro/CI family transcriptional regulator [Pseudomonas sp. 22-AL-CL-001]|uniref:Cro/CI family transcriptional regulator n=1 Tax=Pseudomonas alabamensis TaxID=3064349 RepID=UPI00271406CE|nr:Cro/CI family transcriptional regulator [Pseudomonas sp. 22-AL-CL-001]MDO7911371.1 Cro/CI family transcriptional regulator [Pseudomonas sp. 22-AL-CL-001]